MTMSRLQLTPMSTPTNPTRSSRPRPRQQLEPLAGEGGGVRFWVVGTPPGRSASSYLKERPGQRSANPLQAFSPPGRPWSLTENTFFQYWCRMPQRFTNFYKSRQCCSLPPKVETSTLSTSASVLRQGEETSISSLLVTQSLRLLIGTRLA